MERKHKNHISLWRRAKGLKASELADKLQTYAIERGDKTLPTTAASLSRIEAGEQNFKMNFLVAVAEILSETGDPVKPGDLLDRNPFEGVAKVVSLIDRMSEDQQRRAAEVLTAIFGAGAA